MKLIIGLGNPGEKYLSTRHNIGFRIVDQLREQLEHSSWQPSAKFHAEISRKTYHDHDLLLVKPQTFMNLSGQSIQKIVNFYKLDPTKDLIVTYDDKDLLFGKLRLRHEGSSGGHNGIKSLQKELGTESFSRLKCGVGHEQQDLPTDAFVLQPFSSTEEEDLPEIIAEASAQLISWLEEL